MSFPRKRESISKSKKLNDVDFRFRVNDILRFFSLFLFLSFFCVPLLSAKELPITAKSAIIYDVASGAVLYEKRPDEKLPSASTIKLITAMVVADNSSKIKSGKVTVSATKGLPYRLYLRKGSEYSVESLLYALLLSSSNDAANVLAETVAGSIGKFTDMMNEKAASVGAKDTKFANPSGLTEKDDEQFTTANDMCRIMSKVVTYPELRRILGERSSVIKGSDGKWIFLRNHNKLLKRYPNTIIGKSGYTLLAGHCFVGYSLTPEKNYVFVILGSKKPWYDMSQMLLYAGCIKKIVDK